MLLLFLIIYSYFWIPAVINQIPIGIPIKEAKAEIKTLPVTVEIKISKCSL